jgi:hypothetical protein
LAVGVVGGAELVEFDLGEQVQRDGQRRLELVAAVGADVFEYGVPDDARPDAGRVQERFQRDALMAAPPAGIPRRLEPRADAPFPSWRPVGTTGAAADAEASSSSDS